MPNFVFVILAAPIVLILVIGLMLWHIAETGYRWAFKKPLLPVRRAKAVRFCDRLKNWIIEHE